MPPVAPVGTMLFCRVSRVWPCPGSDGSSGDQCAGFRLSGQRERWTCPDRARAHNACLQHSTRDDRPRWFDVCAGISRGCPGLGCSGPYCASDRSISVRVIRGVSRSIITPLRGVNRLVCGPACCYDDPRSSTIALSIIISLQRKTHAQTIP